MVFVFWGFFFLYPLVIFKQTVNSGSEVHRSPRGGLDGVCVCVCVRALLFDQALC